MYLGGVFVFGLVYSSIQKFITITIIKTGIFIMIKYNVLTLSYYVNNRTALVFMLNC